MKLCLMTEIEIFKFKGLKEMNLIGKNTRRFDAIRFFAFLICFVSLTINSTAQKNLTNDDLSQQLMAPMPVQNPYGNGNITCSELNNSADSMFAHITADNEFKLDFNPPAGASSYAFINSGSSQQVNPLMAQNPNSSISINRNDRTFAFASDKTITAVIVKGGSINNGGGVNVYTFPLGAVSGSGFTTIDSRFDISHISFCFQSNTAPTAAEVTVSGRVTNGKRGIPNAHVYLTDQNGETKIVTTNSLGYYQLTSVIVGRIYIMHVLSKRHTFQPKVLTVNEEIAELNFASEQ
jgi:hypothetical protein